MQFKYLILGFMLFLNVSHASDSFMMLSGWHKEEPDSFNVKLYHNLGMPNPHDIMYLKELITDFHRNMHSNNLGEEAKRDYKAATHKKFNLHEEDLVKGRCTLMIVRKGREIKGGGFIYLRPENAVFLKCAGLMTDEDQAVTFKTMFDYLSSKENFPGRNTLTVFMREDQETCKTLANYGFKLTCRSLSDYSGDQYDSHVSHKPVQRYQVLQKSIE